MSDYAQKLHDQRNRLIEEARGVLDTADNEKRDLSAEEGAKYDKIMADVSSLDQRTQSYLDAEARNSDIEKAFGGIVKPDARKQKEDSDPFETYLRTANKGDQYEIRGHGVEFRDLTKFNTSGVATPTAGGNLVGDKFVPRLYQYMIESSALLSAGPTVLRTTTGEKIVMPKVSSYSTSSQINEGAAIPESDPAFGQLTLDAYKYGHSVQVSHELLNDTAFDLQGFIAMQSGRAVGNALGTDLLLGTGTNEPNGLMVATTVGKTGAGTAPTFDDLIDLEYSVIAPYRRNAKWIIRDATAATLRKVKDGNNNYIWQTSVQAGAPDTLLGYPVFTDPNIAATGAAARSVAFGDISAYYVRLVEGVRFERSDEYAFLNDLVTFRCLLRGDGDLIDPNAVKVFAGA